MTEERDEDRPQIVQLRSGDLGSKEYEELRDHEVIQSSFGSRGKILFKKPTKKVTTDETTAEGDEQQKQQEKIAAELDSIFKEPPKPEQSKAEGEGGSEEGKASTSAVEQETNTEPPQVKKTYLDDESAREGEQPASKRSRLIDRLGEQKATSLSAAKVLAREAKTGNKKLLSFFDQEEEEEEEYRNECSRETDTKRHDQDDDDD